MHNNIASDATFRAGQQIDYKGEHLEIMSASTPIRSYLAFPVDKAKRLDSNGSFVMHTIPFDDGHVRLADQQVPLEPFSSIRSSL